MHQNIRTQNGTQRAVWTGNFSNLPVVFEKIAKSNKTGYK